MSKRHLLRGLDGPHRGMTYELGSRTIIGRAADADIQVLDPNVSRQHAKVVLRDNGTVALVDLGSVNGTIVDDVEVDRIRLRPGSIINVLGTRFAYELVSPEGQGADGGSGAHVLSGRSLRRTAPRLPLSAAQREMAGAKTRIGPVEGLEGLLQVSRDDALTLLDEVLDYRELRVKQLGGGRLGPLEESRLQRLRQKLHRRLDGRRESRRRFQRFSCLLDAEIGRHDGEEIRTITAPVTDLSAGGAQIQTPGHPSSSLAPGEVVWLSVDVSELYQSTPRVVFKTRVAWSEQGGARTGLVFAGQATYARDARSLIAASRSGTAWSRSALLED